MTFKGAFEPKALYDSMILRFTSSCKESAAEKTQDLMVKAETGLLHHRRICGVVLGWVSGGWGQIISLVPRDRTRGKRHKMKQRKFCLNMRKNFFILRVTERWNRLPRGAVESPSLEIIKTRLNAVLCCLLWVTLLRQGVWTVDPQRTLPTPTIL